MRSVFTSLQKKLFPKKSYDGWRRQFAITTTYLGIANRTLEPQNLTRQIAEAETCGDRQLARELKGLAECYDQIQEQPARAIVQYNNALAARKMRELRPSASAA